MKEIKEGEKKAARWKPGGERYSEADRKAMASKYSERPGWHRGARLPHGQRVKKDA